MVLMISSILMFHIFSMITSVVLTVGLFSFAVAARRTSDVVRITNRIVTTLGVIAGAVLLIQHPMLSTCITLTTYVMAFMVAEHYIQKRTTTQASDLK